MSGVGRTRLYKQHKAMSATAAMLPNNGTIMTDRVRISCYQRRLIFANGTIGILRYPFRIASERQRFHAATSDRYHFYLGHVLSYLCLTLCL